MFGRNHPETPFYENVTKLVTYISTSLCNSDVIENAVFSIKLTTFSITATNSNALLQFLVNNTEKVICNY